MRDSEKVACYLPLLACVCLGRCSNNGQREETPPPNPIHQCVFLATVTSIQTIQKFTGVALKVDIDPRFVVTICVLGTPKGCEYSPGDTLNLAVHSVALDFGIGEKEAIGQSFHIKLTRDDRSGENRLEARLGTVGPVSRPVEDDLPL